MVKHFHNVSLSVLTVLEFCSTLAHTEPVCMCGSAHVFVVRKMHQLQYSMLCLYRTLVYLTRSGPVLNMQGHIDAALSVFAPYAVSRP